MSCEIESGTPKRFFAKSCRQPYTSWSRATQDTNGKSVRALPAVLSGLTTSISGTVCWIFVWRFLQCLPQRSPRSPRSLCTLSPCRDSSPVLDRVRTRRGTSDAGCQRLSTPWPSRKRCCRLETVHCPVNRSPNHYSFCLIINNIIPDEKRTKLTLRQLWQN